MDRAWFILAVIVVALAGWLLNNLIRARHGFSVSDDWGRNLTREDPEQARRIAALAAENGQLREELDLVRNRLASVERIVTDGGYRLDHEIGRLRGPAN